MHFPKPIAIQRSACIALWLIALGSYLLSQGQVNRSIPPGFENHSPASPFTSGAGIRGPWETGGLSVYIFDSAPFVSWGPTVFTDLSLRLLPLNPSGDAFDHPAWEVVMGSSVNDWMSGGTATQPGPSSVLLNNYHTDRNVVRPVGRWHSNGKQVRDWVSMQCRRPFYWDPSAGLDLICQISGCGFPTDPYRRTAELPGLEIGQSHQRFWSSASGVCGNPQVTGFGVLGLVFGCETFPAVGVVSSFGHDFARATDPTEFWERCWTADPGGITSWQWDFGDGMTDTGPNPYHTFACAGSYLVRLVATDAGGLSRLYERTVIVEPREFVLETLGMGDLTISGPGINCAPLGVRGHTLISGATTPGVFGNGAFYGLTPDQGTVWTLTQPPGVNNPFHFWATPGAYPDVPFVYPTGTFISASGIPVDAVLIYLDALGSPVFSSNVAQVIL